MKRVLFARRERAANRIVAPALLVILSILSSVPFAASEGVDLKGSSDPSLFPSRMPGYTISTYKVEQFASYPFRSDKGKVTVEGRKTVIFYRRPREVANPGGLAILRNYENAIRQAGGRVVFSSAELRTLVIPTAGGETWAEVKAPSNASAPLYFLTIVEQTSMEQVITADAILAKLETDGLVALHILFDTGKADIKPESLPIVEQIFEALQKTPALMISVEGHTDNSGTPGGNRTLSEARARAVVKALVDKGIAATRLSAVGHGQDKPVADNTTEEGRAKNRRVELVKKR